MRRKPYMRGLMDGLRGALSTAWSGAGFRLDWLLTGVRTVPYIALTTARRPPFGAMTRLRSSSLIKCGQTTGLDRVS